MPLSVKLLLVCAYALLVGCGSAPLRGAQDAFNQGQYDTAVSLLSGDDIRQQDELLALMEKGLILHHVGDYKQSSQVFLEATALLDHSDYISVTEQTLSLAINDWTTKYRGEYAERLWIHTYQMMNFLLLGKPESAAVEARQALVLYDEFADPLEDDHFTRALIAVAFESVNLPNDAYIEYRKLSSLLPDSDAVRSQTAALAKRLGFAQPVKKSSKNTKTNSNYGELLLFVANGRIPRKQAGDLFLYPDYRVSFPVYNFSETHQPSITVTASTPVQTPDSISTNLASVAKTSLSARGKAIAAKQIARVGVKHALVDLAEEESSAAAAILNALFFVLEEADTRAWESLPGRLSLLRIPLPPGTHDIAVTSAGGQHTLDRLTVKPGQRLYRRIRF